ncbi:hypothetical protein B0H12DRAFT_1240564 [Mycena haematopus]|nr:hypothetical protein B0H12DRAFT_1240564 [Mycena haematopus]
MPATSVLPTLSPEDPLFGLIYYVLGGWFIGSSAVLLLEGILIAQVYNYYSWFWEESVPLNLAVLFLFLLTVLRTIQSFAITWINCILFMRDPAGTVALNKEWYQVLNIPLGAVIATYVQSYYCYRLWHFSGKRWQIAPVVLLMRDLRILTCRTGTDLQASVIAKTGKSSRWFAVHVACTFATDVLITGASTFFLIQARNKALSHTRKILSSLIKISCQTALPATTATMIELICSQIGGPSLKQQASNSIILVLLDAVPIIYANCMLYILNARRSLRAGDPSTQSITNKNHPSSSWNRLDGRSIGAIVFSQSCATTQPDRDLPRRVSSLETVG